jgi:hypothetical protein
MAEADATSERSIAELLDDDVANYTVLEWRRRNLDLFRILADRGLIDPNTVSFEAHRFLTETLIQARVGAATDPQNAGHVRAQNENVLHYGLRAGVAAPVLTVALEAGFIHDLNKALGEPLRTDRWAVKDAAGQIVPAMTTMAQIVGLNHLGERTRRALQGATRLPSGALSPEVAEAIDLCIVHHGRGSSRFIEDLINGHNGWWGNEFVDPATGERRLIHPPQPPLTLISLIHDLADSTQQMQGGAAWFMKYPSGFWYGLGRSYAEMLSGPGAVGPGAIPVSLLQQVEVESETCLALIRSGESLGIIDGARAQRLAAAVDEGARSSRDWLDDSPEALANLDGVSVYHDVARVLLVTPASARALLGSERPGSGESDRLEELIWISGQRLGKARAHQLAAMITD